MFFNSLVNIVGMLCIPFFHFIGRKGIRDYWTLQRIKGNKFDVKYSLFRNMLYPDCNELDPFFIIRTIYQYRYQNPTQYLDFYTNQTYVHLVLYVLYGTVLELRVSVQTNHCLNFSNNHALQHSAQWLVQNINSSV